MWVFINLGGATGEGGGMGPVGETERCFDSHKATRRSSLGAGC